MSQVFIEMCGEADRASELGLAATQPMDTCLVDSTCLQANIHFPVDWVLFRDVSRPPLLKAVKLLRAAGLRGRMPNEPPVFATQMNRWCLAMTHSRRRRDAKRARKGVLRQMKRLLRTIGEHARRHRDHLAADYARTRCSERQATRPHHCAHRRHARATAGRDQTGPRTHHRRAISAQRREDPLRLRTRRADRGPGQGVWRGRVWQHSHDQ
ncbi:MAG: hypothetical protein J6386_25985 [Candidatus Synoicihabitans palmerolidicus]|nr:hypothetical protein [Candidatus Synoicihabitans palmerolidicus]MCC5025731.1 hypothetical protein [Candidatus Synoicihabitans palmerolidicus]MCC5025860.1 hypothetical protein [Candidatus Synoicihabitans palmerolidicus]MCC5025873.1 hypothetical protein [Candidatus Synoicihabitans palmerolidicus]MCC5025953.1 hypothetical protein [Candidatus Synoicihabitans palmerolidicus]